jgi:hypothetical protein
MLMVEISIITGKIRKNILIHSHDLQDISINSWIIDQVKG